MPRSHRFAFSMTSLLVVLAILLFLVALFLPFISQVRRAAARTQSINNLKQVGLSVHNYFDANKKLPPLVGKSRVATGTLFFHLLPYLEQDALYRRGLEDWTKVMGDAVPLLIDPQDWTAPPDHRFQDWLATASYAGNWLVFGEGEQSLLVPDGTSNTIMTTQRYQVCNGEPMGWAYNRLHYRAPQYAFYSRALFQTAPGPKECDPSLPQAIDAGGILTGMMDGSVRFVSSRCSPLTWSYATDPSDGNPLGADFE